MLPPECISNMGVHIKFVQFSFGSILLRVWSRNNAEHTLATVSYNNDPAVLLQRRLFTTN